MLSKPRQNKELFTVSDHEFLIKVSSRNSSYYRKQGTTRCWSFQLCKTGDFTMNNVPSVIVEVDDVTLA